MHRDKEQLKSEVQMKELSHLGVAKEKEDDDEILFLSSSTRQNKNTLLKRES